MARKRKQSIDPRQRTLFDYFADNIEKLQEEKTQDNNSQEKKETFYVRQTNQSTGNRKKNSQARNDSGDTPTGFQQSLLSYTRQVGPAQMKYSPDELKALEEEGFLLFRLDQQDTIEDRIA